MMRACAATGRRCRPPGLARGWLLRDRVLRPDLAPCDEPLQPAAGIPAHPGRRRADRAATTARGPARRQPAARLAVGHRSHRSLVRKRRRHPCLGLCDACPDALACEDLTPPRGQALHKPRGRKPRRAPMRFGEAKPLWGLDDSRCGRCSHRASRPEADIASMADVGVARLRSWVMPQARNDVMAAQGQAVRSRRWLPPSGRSVDATDTGAHAATRRAGGARIGWPRARISTMLIAAPQCGQTKVGWPQATGAASAGGGVVGTTCSSSRAWARCSRRWGSSRQGCQSWEVRVLLPSIARIWADSISTARRGNGP